MTDLNGPPGASSAAAGQPDAPAAVGPPAIDPTAVMRSKPYVAALLLAAALGVPISAVAYGFLALVTAIQEFLFQDLPGDIFDTGVCHMAFFKDPDGNQLMLHRRYAPRA